ncbi:MAG: Gfo/Idh/MocA family oxidoreductase [Planctomycetes bacterium]|nr:Gfo/Idh/MocA family oxidoreductase [Planctomycetota bacterium]
MPDNLTIEKNASETKLLRIGVIGLGVGAQHIPAYKENSNCEVVSLCDIDAAKRTEFAVKYPNMLITFDASQVLNDPTIDVVSIASYDDVHAQQIITALDNDKHVFVEKPLCLHADEVRDIRHALKQRPHLKLSSNLILRRSPRFMRIKQMIEDGSFGELYHLEAQYNYGRLAKITDGWRGEIPYYSVVLGGGVHIIDQLLWMTKQRVVEVAAFGNRICSNNTNFKHDDMVAAILRFENSMTATITANFGCVRPHGHGLEIYGTKATFVNGEPDGFLYTSRDPSDKPQVISDVHPGAAKGDLIASFVDSILDIAEPEVSADEVFDVMSVCLAIDKAKQQNRTIEVEYI